MAYNIDGIDIIHRKDFSINPELRKTLVDNYMGDLPESNCLEEDCDLSKCFWWQGERSGRTFDLLKNILAAFDGEVDLVLTWEGGDSHTGLRLRNHVVTEHEVVFSLGKETK